jgi:hypothetical protein
MEYYAEQGWTDGLPVVPPTPVRVARFLDRAGRPASAIIGTEPTKGRVITAEKVAINAVMAGCLPEHLAVVLTAVEAICEPKFNLHAVSVSTMGAAVLTVVNGPIAAELGLRSGVDLFGPGNRGNATIGRAIRLVITNATGAVSGELDKAALGHPGKYTWCFAEAMEASPWASLHEEKGLSTFQSAVTVYPGLSPFQVNPPATEDPELILASFADALFATGPGQEDLVVVMSLEIVGHLKAAGWSKDRVKEALYRAGRRPASEWARVGAEVSVDKADALIGAVNSPESVTVIVAGGEAGGGCAVIQLWGGGTNSRPVTKEINI